MKILLLKLAHLIMSKYGVVPLGMGDHVFIQGKEVVVQSYTISHGEYGFEVEVSMIDPDFISKRFNL